MSSLSLKTNPECGSLSAPSPPLVTAQHDAVTPSSATRSTPHSLASLFLHPASLAASLAGYPPHPWTISWMNAAASYGFVNAAMDLSTVQQRSSLSSIADLRLKAKRHAEELINVSSSGGSIEDQDRSSPL